MFYRATEQSDGSGIGLYIVKNAVDKLGGKISVASKSGQGTRFSIILPNRVNSISKPVSRFVEEG
jgi:signal transduction histidine kinase